MPPKIYSAGRSAEAARSKGLAATTRPGPRVRFGEPLSVPSLGGLLTTSSSASSIGAGRLTTAAKLGSDQPKARVRFSSGVFSTEGGPASAPKDTRLSRQLRSKLGPQAPAPDAHVVDDEDAASVESAASGSTDEPHDADAAAVKVCALMSESRADADGGQFDDAAECLFEAALLTERWAPGSHQSSIMCAVLEATGDLFLRFSRPDTAMVFFNRAITIHKNLVYATRGHSKAGHAHVSASTDADIDDGADSLSVAVAPPKGSYHARVLAADLAAAHAKRERSMALWPQSDTSGFALAGVGHSHLMLGEPSWAGMHLERAVAALRLSAQRVREREALTRSSLTRGTSASSVRSGATSVAREAAEAGHAGVRAALPALAAALDALALVHRMEQNYVTALEYATEALNLSQLCHGENDARTGRAHRTLALCAARFRAAMMAAEADAHAEAVAAGDDPELVEAAADGRLYTPRPEFLDDMDALNVRAIASGEAAVAIFGTHVQECLSEMRAVREAARDAKLATHIASRGGDTSKTANAARAAWGYDPPMRRDTVLAESRANRETALLTLAEVHRLAAVPCVGAGGVSHDASRPTHDSSGPVSVHAPTRATARGGGGGAAVRGDDDADAASPSKAEVGSNGAWRRAVRDHSEAELHYMVDAVQQHVALFGVKSTRAPGLPGNKLSLELLAMDLAEAEVRHRVGQHDTREGTLRAHLSKMAGGVAVSDRESGAGGATAGGWTPPKGGWSLKPVDSGPLSRGSGRR